MKRVILHSSGYLLVVCLLGLSTVMQAQVTQKSFQFEKPKVVNFKELSEFEKNNPVTLKPRFIEQGEDRDHFIFKPHPVKAGIKVEKIAARAAGEKTAAVTANSPATSQNFQGVLDNGTLIPPDINGAVGTNYVVETTNQQFNIYAKSTGALNSTVSITTLFSPSGLSGYYDPHIVYDPNNDRFIICIDAGSGTAAAPSYFALAVSASGDPTGSWYIYKVECTPSSTTDFMDYPMLGFSSNWIVMTGNDFPASGSNSTHIYVWPKTTLYAGGAGTATTFVDANNILVSPASTYDASVSTVYMVSDYNGNSGGNGYVNIGTVTGTSTPSYSAGTQLAVNQPWGEPTALLNAPQLGETAAKGLEAGDTRIHSCIYRNGSLWFTHSVFLPSSGSITNGAVDWWQVNPSALSVTQFGRISDPAAKIWYYYPSLDVNANGDMLIGYSTSSSTTYGGAQYALHLASDPANTLESAVQFVNGVAGYYKTYGGNRNRWGDFSGTAFDPTDGSFWTFQEWANTGNNWGTQIAHVPASSVASCNTPTGMTTSNIANTTATFNWTAVSGATGYNVQYRITGTTTWTTGTTATNSFNATNLTAGSTYEWQVQTVCSATSTSSFSGSTNFTTTGGVSCGTPIGLTASSITTTSATVSWTAVSGATSYNLQYKVSTAGSYTTVSGLTSTSYNLTGLTSGTAYQYQVQAVCSSGAGAYSSPSTFTTSSGSVTYCASKGTTTYEYIKTVVLGSINHTSANDGGYGNYTSTTTNLAAGSSYTITLTPGFTGSKYAENFTVYIDYNDDGTLNGTGETVLTLKSARTGTATSGSFKVPATAKTGSTRMRIQMSYGSASTNPCATITYGDVQDYTVNVTGGSAPAGDNLFVSGTAPEAISGNNLSVIPNPLSRSANGTAVYNLAKDGNTTLQVVDLTGKILYTQNMGVQNAGQHNYLLYKVTANLRSGYYLVVLKQDNQVVARNRFVVAK